MAILRWLAEAGPVPLSICQLKWKSLAKVVALTFCVMHWLCETSLPWKRFARPEATLPQSAFRTISNSPIIHNRDNHPIHQSSNHPIHQSSTMRQGLVGHHPHHPPNSWRSKSQCQGARGKQSRSSTIRGCCNFFWISWDGQRWDRMGQIVGFVFTTTYWCC